MHSEHECMQTRQALPRHCNTNCTTTLMGVGHEPSTHSLVTGMMRVFGVSLETHSKWPIMNILTRTVNSCIGGERSQARHDTIRRCYERGTSFKTKRNSPWGGHAAPAKDKPTTWSTRRRGRRAPHAGPRNSHLL